MPGRRGQYRRRRQRQRRYLQRRTPVHATPTPGNCGKSAITHPPEPVAPPKRNNAREERRKQKQAAASAAAQGRRQQKRAAVTAALLDNPRRPSSHIAEAIGASPDLVRQIRTALEDDKRIHRYEFSGLVARGGKHRVDCWCGGPDPDDGEDLGAAATEGKPYTLEPSKTFHFALVRWNGLAMRPPRFYTSRAAALADAPDDEPFSVVDVAKSRRNREGDDLL